MQTHSKIKYFLLPVLLLIILGIYFFYQNIEQPYRLSNPESFEQGTELSVYKDLPPSFPKEFILGDVRPSYSGQLELPDGLTQTSVEFSHTEGVVYLVNTYRDVLFRQGWTVTVDTATREFGILRAEKNNFVVAVSIAPVSAFETLITIQYDK